MYTHSTYVSKTRVELSASHANSTLATILQLQCGRIALQLQSAGLYCNYWIMLACSQRTDVMQLRYLRLNVALVSTPLPVAGKYTWNFHTRRYTSQVKWWQLPETNTRCFVHLALVGRHCLIKLGSVVAKPLDAARLGPSQLCFLSKWFPS